MPPAGLSPGKCSFPSLGLPSIATQLNSTRRRVELRRYRHPHWVTTFRTDRWQLFTLWTCRQLDVELSCVGVATDTSPTQLNSTHWVELCRYKRAFTQAWKQTSGDPQTWNYRGITLLYNFTTALLYMVSSVTMARIVAMLLIIYWTVKINKRSN